MAKVSPVVLENSRIAQVPSRKTYVSLSTNTNCPFHIPQLFCMGSIKKGQRILWLLPPCPMVCLKQCFMVAKTCVWCILQFSQSLWRRYGRTLSHMLDWRHTQENFTACPKPQACECQIWHRLLDLEFGMVSMPSCCVKCETLGWGLRNLYEVSHRGGSPPKFQSECRPWFAVTLIPPRLSLSLSQH